MGGILERIEERLERLELRLAKCDAPLGGYIDQRSSPLGRRKHCAAVRRRVAAGDEGAAIVGRHFMLSPDALRDELRIESEPANTTGPARPDDAADEEFFRNLIREVGG